MFSRIHPFALDNSSSRASVYSRHDPGQSNFVSSVSYRISQYCPSVIVFMKSVLEHSLINLISSGGFANFRLDSNRKFPCSVSLVRSLLIVVDNPVDTNMVSDLIAASDLLVLSEQSEILEMSSSRMSVTVPQNWKKYSCEESIRLFRRHHRNVWLIFLFLCFVIILVQKYLIHVTEVEQYVHRDSISFDLYVWVPYQFFSDPGPRNGQCPCVNLFVCSATMLEFVIHNSLFPFSLQTLSLYKDMKMIRPGNCPSSHCISVIMFWIST